jgi:hypothetical protein
MVRLAQAQRTPKLLADPIPAEALLGERPRNRRRRQSVRERIGVVGQPVMLVGKGC